MHKRPLIAILAAASVAAGATVAEAAVPKGTYSGKTSDGGAVKLTVSKTQKLVKVTRKSLRFTCTDGDKFRSLSATASGSVDVADGSFDISDTTESDGVTWAMTGKFSTKKRKVKGTYSETRRFNDQNELDPNGTITCKTAALTYSAALPKKR
ncbi:MAG: hypothetical protein M3340_10665 [Actinomycetota bacterium]|nr:hypothetical protein [Actinomycetota bacterium]